MMELVDMTDSKSVGIISVPVRVRLGAPFGWLVEWLNTTVLKTVEHEYVPCVRIAHHPPLSFVI